MSPTTPTSSSGDTLGELIRTERERQGLSLRELGRLVGADPSAVLLWEHDKAVPKAKYLSGLARALELPTQDLFDLTGAEYNPHDAPSLPAMLRAEYDLPPEAVAEIEKHITKVAKKYGITKKSSKDERRSP